MKKFLTLLLFLLSGFFFAAKAFEIQMNTDYLITTEDSAKKITVANPEILTITPFCTIYNEKDVMMLHPEKIGKTSFTIFLEGKSKTFSVIVTPEKKGAGFKPIQENGFEIILLDNPPKPQGE